MDWLKKRKVVIILSSILVAIAMGWYLLLRDATVLEVAHEVVIYEYGEKIELTAKGVLKNTDKEVLTNSKIESNLENEIDKEYPKLGKYEATVSYKKEKAKIDIEIKDTKAPVFNACGSIEFIKGTDFDYGQYVVATDLQVVMYTWEKELVDINVAGEYTMKVIASDASDNKATKDIKVNVLEAVDNTTNDITTSVDESGNVKTIVTQKPKVEDASNNAAASKNTQSSKPSTSNPSTPTPEKTPKPEEPHQHYASFISPLFDTEEEREQWADNYLYSQSVPWKYEGYGTSTCSCGKKGVTHFY